MALFGTYQIAANGVAQSIWSLAALTGISMSPVFITVIGRVMGDHDIVQAEMYFKKLLKITFIISIIWNALILFAMPLILHFYALTEETKQLVLDRKSVV